MKAVWKGVTLAESDDTVEVDGNQYFPPGSLVKEHFEPASLTTVCPWKGTAHYYDVVVNGERNAEAAWYYPEAKKAASKIEGRVAFWRGVEVRAD